MLAVYPPFNDLYANPQPIKHGGVQAGCKNKETFIIYLGDMLEDKYATNQPISYTHTPIVIIKPLPSISLLFLKLLVPHLK